MQTLTPEYISKLVVQLVSVIVGLVVSFGMPISTAERAAILAATILLVPALVEVGWLIFRGHVVAAKTVIGPVTVSTPTTPDQSASGSSGAAGGNISGA